MIRFISVQQAKDFCGIKTNQHDEILGRMIEAISEDILVSPKMAALWEGSEGEVPDGLVLALYIRLAMSMHGHEIAIDAQP